MTPYPANQLLKKFGNAVTALSKKLPKNERDNVNQSWQVVERAIKVNSADFEALAEYKSLIIYLRTSGLIDPNGREWEP